MMFEAGTALVEQLVDEFPPLRSLLDDHLAESGMVLPHLFLGRVASWAEQLEAEGESSELRRLLDWFESRLERASQDERNLIDLGFVENLPPVSDSGTPSIARHLPSELKRSYEAANNLGKS